MYVGVSESIGELSVFAIGRGPERRVPLFS